MARPLFETLDCSHNRKCFAVGDIHGEFLKLTNALLDLGFDPETDVLISVGDLVDRGPFSEEFERWLERPCFHRVLGNHDLQPREYLLGYESAENVIANGGQWWIDKPREEIERIASLLEDAPLALEVTTPKGRKVGITHADTYTEWAVLPHYCQDPELTRKVINFLTGSRESIRAIQNEPELDPNDIRVRNIDHVFHGHTPIERPLTFANRTWIDTQIDDNPTTPLTVLEIDDWLDNL